MYVHGTRSPLAGMNVDPGTYGQWPGVLQFLFEMNMKHTRCDSG